MLTYNVLNEYVERMKKNDLVIVSTTNDIKTLTTDDINKLRAGDIVLKEDESGKHAYVVSYKKDGTGICLTYTDATYIETISYDYNSVTKEWTYNSMDATEVQPKLTAGNNIAITNNVISATDTTYTAGTGIDITNGVISATSSGSQLYLHNIVLTKAYSISCITLSIINDNNSAIDTLDKLKQYLIDKGFTQDTIGKAYNATGFVQGTGSTVYDVLGIIYISDSSSWSLQIYDGTGFSFLTGNTTFNAISDTVVTL